jgi:hypothetical protein
VIRRPNLLDYFPAHTRPAGELLRQPDTIDKQSTRQTHLRQQQLFQTLDRWS